MTIMEIRKQYGSKEGYISCSYCPVSPENCTLEHATGFADCWSEIAKLFPEEISKETIEETGNLYWERITALAERQREKGMSKYGQGLEMNPADILERINHLQEELIDGLMYCEWIKEHFNEAK